MRWNRNEVLIALTVALGADGTVMAQEPSVVTPEGLNAARAVERNTYHDEQFVFEDGGGKKGALGAKTGL